MWVKPFTRWLNFVLTFYFYLMQDWIQLQCVAVRQASISGWVVQRLLRHLAEIQRSFLDTAWQAASMQCWLTDSPTSLTLQVCTHLLLHPNVYNIYVFYVCDYSFVCCLSVFFIIDHKLFRRHVLNISFVTIMKMNLILIQANKSQEGQSVPFDYWYWLH